MTDTATDPTEDLGQPKLQTDVINQSDTEGQTLSGQSLPGKAKQHFWDNFFNPGLHEAL